MVSCVTFARNSIPPPISAPQSGASSGSDSSTSGDGEGTMREVGWAHRHPHLVPLSGTLDQLAECPEGGH